MMSEMGMHRSILITGSDSVLTSISTYIENISKQRKKQRDDVGGSGSNPNER